MKAIQFFHTTRKIFSFEGLPAKVIRCVNATPGKKAVILCQKQDGEYFGIDPQGEIVIIKNG